MKKSELVTIILVSIISFLGMYVCATMNAIDDKYQMGLDDFKFPFQIIIQIILMISVVWLLASLLSSKVRNLSHKYLISFSVGVLTASILVLVLGFAPCIKSHPTTAPHHTHHDLYSVVERSLLCPRYSNRSYPFLMVFITLGGVMLGVGRWGSQKNA